MAANQQLIKSLPFEVLLRVFTPASTADLCEFALVCKAWLNPAQSILYSDVKIGTVLQLKIFCNTLKHNPHLGMQVKVFHTERRLEYELSEANQDLTLSPSSLCNESSKTDEVYTLLSTLIYNELSNLQELDDCCLKTYEPVLHALQDSRLENLKVLKPPESYSTDDESRKNYISCILLMRDRTEEVTLHATSDLSPDSLIYNKLVQLNKLQEIDIAGTDRLRWFEILEHVTATCKSLKKVKFNFSGGTDGHLHADIDLVTPSKSVESVNALIGHDDMLPYLMKKFPKLRKLRIFHYFAQVHYKPEQLTQILSYLRGIDIYDVSRFPVNGSISEFIANHLDGVSAELGSKTVETCYYDMWDDEQYGLDIFKREGESEATFSIIFHIARYCSQHIDVMDKLGKYIGEFHFKYVAEGELYDFPPKRNLPPEFIDHLLMRCQHLHTLHFVGWVFQIQDISYPELPIGELYFKECVFYGDFLGHLSPYLPHLKRLILEKVIYIPSSVLTRPEYECCSDDALKINMPQTHIDTVELHRSRREPSYVKLFVASERTYHYYEYKGGYFETIVQTNEKEYNAAENYSCVFIHCFNKPRIQFKNF